MVLVVRVKPVYVERVVYLSIIALLVFSTYHFYSASKDAIEGNTIIVNNGSSQTGTFATFEELNVTELEEEVAPIIPDPEPAPVQEEPEEPAETCSDGIKNQDETKTDCGGVCKACPAPKPSVPEASGEVVIDVTDYEYEWTSTSRGKLSLVKFNILNDLGEDINDGELQVFFYGASEDLELKSSADVTMDIETIPQGGTHRDILFATGKSPAFTFCCVNDQSTQKTLKMVFKSKQRDLDITKTIIVK